MGSAALAAAVVLLRCCDPNLSQGIKKCVEKERKKKELNNSKTRAQPRISEVKGEGGGQRQGGGEGGSRHRNQPRTVNRQKRNPAFSSVSTTLELIIIQETIGRCVDIFS